MNAELCPYQKALSLIFALQIRESAFGLLTRGDYSNRCDSKIDRVKSLYTQLR